MVEVTSSTSALMDGYEQHERPDGRVRAARAALMDGYEVNSHAEIVILGPFVNYLENVDRRAF
jgi:hypothetical protein